MPFTIRRAESSDIDQIIDFNCRLAQETEGKTLEPAVVRAGVQAALSDRHKGPYYLAVDGERILGQLQITFEWSDWRNGWIWWIQGVYVRAEARRQGIFRALYGHIENAARESQDVIGIRLYVEKENRKAQKTYEEMGMKPSSYLMYERYYFTP
ncbi:MAG: GNAT family N-acetyltransferase [Gemmataceae bacterium]